MNKILISGIILCILGIGSGCKEKNKDKSVEVIHINPFEASEEINLSEFVDSIIYIKLQTDSICVLGRLHDIIIREKYIYASDISQQILFVFDKNGKYITKLDKRGKGPDEYLRMSGVFIDDNEEFIELINSSGKNSILKYSNITFKLIEKRPIINISSNSCIRHANSYYFATQQNENIINDKPTNANLIIIKENRVVKLFDKNIITNHSSFSPYLESFIKNDKNELFVSIVYDNTFYRIEDLSVHPAIRIDFGKFGIDNSIGNKPLTEQLKYVKKINGLASFPVLNLNNSEIMSFSYGFKQDIKERMFKDSDYRQYIKLKKNNKTFHTKVIKNDLSGFPAEVHLNTTYHNISHDIWYKDYLVDIILPYKLFSNGEKRMMTNEIGEINIEDNPIIILMKLKKDLRMTKKSH